MNHAFRPPISIVIPCLNEADSIPVVIPFLLEQNKGKNFEIIVIDDCSTDNSCELLEKYPEVTLVKNTERLGYGGSLKKGFGLAQGRYLTFFDLDRTYNCGDLPSLYNEITEKNLAIVFGNRMSKKNEMPLVRYIGNAFYARILQLLFWVKIEDACTGFRIFQRELVPHILKIEENGLNFSIAFTVQVLKRRLSFSQLTIRYDERIGESKLSVFYDGFQFLKSIFYHSLKETK